MALKRSYATGTKFLYAKVVFADFMKDTRVYFRIQILERDLENLEFDEPLYSIDIHAKGEDFQEYFSVEKLSEVNINILTQCYEWTKIKADQFRDFSDC